MSEKESTPSRYSVCQFSSKTHNFDFTAQICPKMELGLEVQKTNVGISQLSVNTENFELLDLNLGKLLNYVQYFGSYNVEDESWVEAEMSWMEVGGDGWSWVEMGARFSNTRRKYMRRILKCACIDIDPHQKNLHSPNL